MDEQKYEAFTIGFIAKLAEYGIAPDEYGQIFEKDAIDKSLAAIISGISDAAPAAILGLGVGVPVAAGVGTGWLRAKMDDVSEDDIKRMKKRQELQTLKRIASRAKRKAEIMQNNISKY